MVKPLHLRDPRIGQNRRNVREPTGSLEWPVSSIVRLKYIEDGVYGDLIIYPKPYSIYLRGSIHMYIYTHIHYQIL